MAKRKKDERLGFMPNKLDEKGLADYIAANHKLRFTEEVKRYFTPEEIQSFEHESSVNGRMINKLEDILALVRDKVRNGTDEPINIEIPVSQGSKLLVEFRRQNDDFIEKGYESEEIEIFGIPDLTANKMYFVTITGDYIREADLTEEQRKLYSDISDTTIDDLLGTPPKDDDEILPPDDVA
jgi:hypothetical protein